MAISKLALLFLSLTFSLLAVSVTVTARPCKTLFFLSTTTSYYPITTSESQNPNPNLSLRYQNPRSLTLFFTTAPFRHDGSTKFGFDRPSILLRRSVFFNRRFGGGGIDERVKEEEANDVSDRFSSSSSSMRIMPVDFYSSVTSSIRDRTKDIMKVVGALLFGVGCGAITAATMYLIWSLFWPNRFDFEESDDDFDDCDDDFSAKKVGYVAIPAAKFVDDDLKKPAPLAAKEVV